jgi:hypothetical protein
MKFSEAASYGIFFTRGVVLDGLILAGLLVTQYGCSSIPAQYCGHGVRPSVFFIVVSLAEHLLSFRLGLSPQSRGGSHTKDICQTDAKQQLSDK